MRQLTKDEHDIFVDRWGADLLGRWMLLAAVAQTAGILLVDALHQRERSLAEHSMDSSLRMINQAPFVKTYGLNPFFAPGTKGTEDRLRAFAKAIYPIWEPIVRRANEDAAAPGGEIGSIDEIAVLHACEDAIVRSGHFVDRSGTAETAMNKRKAKVLKTLSQAEQAIDWQSRAAGDDTRED